MDPERFTEPEKDENLTKPGAQAAGFFVFDANEAAPVLARKPKTACVC
jgi:hypothetical protein